MGPLGKHQSRGKATPAGSKSHGKKTSQSSDLQEIERLNADCSEVIDTARLRLFTDLPLSERTKQGLARANYLEMTDIQRGSLGYALAGRDVLGAAKTGSGKTLAFLIPILEALYRKKWTHMDGLGALVISPTRELAVQIFNVLRKIGRQHTLSAGLVIGGKDVEFERAHVGRMNILVCTPGRLLQHMDETPMFDCNNLQVLVLDEADRILDMGFRKSINAIVENLPATRQTLLFSATQTKSVRDLARLSLHDPEYVAVHEQSEQSTPETLQQSYLVCELHEKLDVLYAFIKSHLKSKCLVFLSSCKQVRFVYEAFCKMQPGTIIMSLHGKQNQSKRNVMFEKFCNVKHAVMLCTDIAARGLDFPAVDWVLQADAPEDADTYIHRVGRTARFQANGKALLFLVPSEEKGMLELLEKKKVPLKRIKVNPAKTTPIMSQLQSICAECPDIKYLGEKALVCYLRSVWLQKNKEVFDVNKLPIEEFAASLGLPGAPKVKFVRKLKAEKNQSRAEVNAEKRMADVGRAADVRASVDNSDEEDIESEDEVEEKAPTGKKHATEVVAAADDSSSDSEAAPGKQRTRLDKLFAKKNQSLLWDHSEKMKERGEDSLIGGTALADGDDGFLTLARADHELEGVPTMAPGFLERPLSVRDKRSIKTKARVLKNNDANPSKMVFDEDGTPHLTWKLETETEFNNAEDTVFSKHQKYLDAALAVMKTADQEDKQVAKEKRREKRQMLKAKAKGVPKEEAVAYLGQASDDDANDYESAGEERRDDASFGDNSDAGEDFDIDLNEDDDVVSAPPPPAPIKKLKAKKRKQAAAVDTVADDLDDGSDDLKPKRARKTISSINIQDMANEEELALKLLQASR